MLCVQDRSKCSCHQLTLEASRVSCGGKENPDAGYKHRRLEEQVITGYEYTLKSNYNINDTTLFIMPLKIYPI